MSLSFSNCVQSRTNKRLFSVDEYERMAQNGVLRPDERTELIEGIVLSESTVTPRHAGAVTRINREIAKVAGDKFLFTSRSPVVLGKLNMPEPDVLLLKPRKDFYKHAYPTAEDCVLFVEVADSTLALDRNLKLPMYARQGVKEAWLVDLKKNRVEVHRKPTKSGYADVQSFTKTATIELSQCKGVKVSLPYILR